MRPPCGWIRLGVLVAVTAAALAQEADEPKLPAERTVEGAAEAVEATVSQRREVTADDVQTAWQAWTKLRDALRQHFGHAARRRSASALGQVTRAGAESVGHTEFTLSAESSFTAVSRALDRLAQSSSRSLSGPVIAATEFVVEGDIDADTIHSYLRSQHAASLAQAEANALRKVVGKLLASQADNTTVDITRDAAEKRMVIRSAPRPPPPPPASKAKFTRWNSLEQQVHPRFRWPEKDDVDGKDEDVVAPRRDGSRLLSLSSHAVDPYSELHRFVADNYEGDGKKVSLDDVLDDDDDDDDDDDGDDEEDFGSPGQNNPSKDVDDDDNDDDVNNDNNDEFKSTDEEGTGNQEDSSSKE